jgi:hypothetical protein
MARKKSESYEIEQFSDDTQIKKAKAKKATKATFKAGKAVAKAVFAIWDLLED